MIACACGCGNMLKPHFNRKTGAMTKFLLGHNVRTLEGKKIVAKNGKLTGRKNILRYANSKAGKKHAASVGSRTLKRYNNSANGKRHIELLHNKWSRSSEGRKAAKINIRIVRNTESERILKSKLRSWHVDFDRQKSVSMGRHKTGHYNMDFFLPFYRIDFEVDGVNHSIKRIRRRDARRDEYLLREYNIRTIRIKNRKVAGLTRKEFIRMIELPAAVEKVAG